MADSRVLRYSQLPLRFFPEAGVCSKAGAGGILHNNRAVILQEKVAEVTCEERPATARYVSWCETLHLPADVSD